MKTEERDSVIKEKAEILLYKLYRLRRYPFAHLTVKDILLYASDDDINYYYHWLCEGGNR